MLTAVLIGWQSCWLWFDWLTEQLAANLHHWLQSEAETIPEEEEEEEESVFSTITSNMGNSLSKKMRDGIECECL